MGCDKQWYQNTPRAIILVSTQTKTMEELWGAIREGCLWEAAPQLHLAEETLDLFFAD